MASWDVRAGVLDCLRQADVVVVGAGLFGLTVAEQTAGLLGRRVCVLDRRRHLGGTTHSDVDADTGIEVHRFGTHVFHTSDPRVREYLASFTRFTAYRHRVFARHAGQLYPMPISLSTITGFFGRAMSPDEARLLVAEQAAEMAGREPRNLEEMAVSRIGRPLYEAFVRGYTRKQWQADPRDLPAQIVARLPVRFTFDDRYFADPWQGLPQDGYPAWHRRMCDRPGLDVLLGVDHAEIRGTLSADQLVVYSGPIDAYFDHADGPLSWRTLDFERETVPVGDFQGTAVVNYVDEEVPFTRIHEFRHLHPERTGPNGRTVISREFSRTAGATDEPFYPVRTPRDLERLASYQARAAAEPNVVFGGRLGSYRYLDMDQAVAEGLRVFASEVVPWLSRREARW